MEPLPGIPEEEEIATLQSMTRDLVGVAMRSLKLLEGRVSLAQFRMLAILDELGPSPSSAVARAMGAGASSVTRLADRLESSGHVVRGHDPRNRSVVRLEPTAAGRDLVARVLRWRRQELARILRLLPPDERAGLTAGLRRFHDAVAGMYGEEEAGRDPRGPVHL